MADQGRDTNTNVSGIDSKRFQKDLQQMLFGFGDAWPSNQDTLSLAEILVKQYIEDICQQALVIAEIRGKLDVECFLFLVRKDPRKFNRLQNLIAANESLKKARTIEELSSVV